ncbi:Conserved_hypothetical protein [Hexamita inflata]|uniref:Transmembrane protein n=1 Tax=Hexamita inflata TaxID=28002 RepID=A0AA86NL79_9EUKA|nr:Conserved hypothetical protein [Hexamita inflata]
MQFALLILMDKLITDKTEIVDCYTAATNIRFLTLNGQRSFRIYLNPTQKQDCNQFPRGMNVTIFATKLVDGGNNFIPNSVIIYDFNYASTVGISIPCTQCADDTYFSSDQVIITMESAIHYTRVVAGAVQTERGLQVNCFVNTAIVIDFSSILITATPSGSCPQIVSADPAKLKNIASADFFIVYENGNIDRYEKLTFGTQVTSSIYPPAANAINYYNVSIPNIGMQSLESGFQYMQLQIYFVDSGVPIMTAIQATKFQFASFPGAYLNIDMQVQKSAVYLDMIVNNITEVSPGLVLCDYYNYLIFYIIQPDGFIPQFYGYSSVIPNDQILAQPFQEKSSMTTIRSAPMTFTSPVSVYGFVTMKIQVTCDMVQELDCDANVDKFLAMSDSNYQMNMYVKFYKAGVMVKAVSQAINKVYDSCFNSAAGYLTGDSLIISIERNPNSKTCNLVEGQKVDIMLNFTEYKRSTHWSNYSFFNYVLKDFSYNITLPLTKEQNAQLTSYMSREETDHQLFNFIYFKVNGQTVDQAPFSPLYKNDLTLFKEKSKQMIIYLGVVSVIICVMITVIPIICKRMKPRIQRNKEIKQKIGIAIDQFDL